MHGRRRLGFAARRRRRRAGMVAAGDRGDPARGTPRAARASRRRRRPRSRSCRGRVSNALPVPRRRPDVPAMTRARHDSGETSRTAFIVTCEHGGNAIPAAYGQRFAGREALLATHRGYDPGALGIARDLARALRATLVVSTVSRLLVELNRSPGRQFRFSPVMREAPPPLREEICRRHYTPYRQKVESFVARAVA